jgi:ketosteroid isomerase-like protein
VFGRSFASRRRIFVCHIEFCAQRRSADMKPTLLFFVLQLCAVTFALAQSPGASPTSAQTREPFETISRMDAQLFDAFNAHNLDAVMSMFSDDVEFYQDNDGVSNYAQTKSDFAKMFASIPDIKRELVKGTLEVYPIKDYGAIEIGVHRFCHKENGKEECGSFKFVHIWRKIDNSWKISRVVSYGH